MLPINEVSTIWWDKNKGQILKQARRAKGYSVRKVTEELTAMGQKYSRQSLTAIENGDINTLSFGLFINICRILDFNPSSVIPMLTVSEVNLRNFASLT